MMAEFLVEIEIAPPPDLEAGELERLRARERVRAGELAQAGHLIRLWRTAADLEAGRWANLGLWRADDEQQLRTLLASLPLAPYMAPRVTVLVAHPSDPTPVAPPIAQPLTQEEE